MTDVFISFIHERREEEAVATAVRDVLKHYLHRAVSLRAGGV